MLVSTRENLKQDRIKEEQMSNSEALCSLAMLKVNIDTGGDYLEYIKPYIIDILVNDPPERVTDYTVASKLLSSCGLEIPTRTVQIVLQRLAKGGLLVKKDGVFIPSDNLPESDLSAVRANASRHISLIVNELIGFARSISDRVLTEDAATECLVSFLSNFSIPCLRTYLRGTTLPDVSTGANWQVSLVGHFVGELQNQPNLLESFTLLMQGHMLANALLCPDLNSVSDSYTDVVFYFDTPLLIQLLGLEGEQEEQAIKEVVSLVRKLKGKVCYFSHTYDELTTSIKISAEFIESQKGRGTIVNEARKSGKKKSDLILLASQAAEILEEYGVTSEPTPSYAQENHKFEIAEEVFASVLGDEIDYSNPRAKDYDIRSVRSIYVLRKGCAPQSVEKAKAVLVTSNTSFSKAAFEYGKTIEMSREVSTVITDFSLANTAWLKAPQGAPALPKKEILAFAYAAARPSKGFWDQVLLEADKLEHKGRITARDHQFLRSSYTVQSELAKLTLGDVSALTEESITKTLARVTDEIRGEELEERNVINKKLDEATVQIGSLVGSLDSVRENIYWSSKKRADSEAKILSASIWIAQVLVAICGFFALKKEDSSAWLFFVIAALSAIVRLAGAQWDIKPINIGPKYAGWRLQKLHAKRLSELGLKQDDLESSQGEA